MDDKRKRRILQAPSRSRETVSDVVIDKSKRADSLVTPQSAQETQLPDEDEQIASVTLSIVEGPLAGAKYEYDSPTSLVIGRSRDCSIRLPSDEGHKTISRHHCLIDLAPPEIRIRDFGSLNGTWVNGVKIGQRESRAVSTAIFPEYDLGNGDLIKLGATVFKVSIAGNDDATFKQYPSARHFLDEWLDRLPKRQAFTVERELGRGGMGVAFLARDRGGKTCALKVLLPQGLMNKRHRQRFRRELTMMKRLHHENIVSLEDYFVHEGGYILVLEYCDGGTLAQLLERTGGTIPLEQALEYQKQLLGALEHAHKEGVIHRDISPDNILFSNQSGKTVLKLADFGLAKACEQAGLSGLTRTGTVGGKPHFMSRNLVIDFKYASPRADLWSAMAILYHCLTGATPRDFPDDKDPWTIVLGEIPRPIAERRTKIPQPLAEAIDSVLDEKSTKEFSATVVKGMLMDAVEE